MYINSDCSSIGQHNYNLHNQLKNNFEGNFFSSKIKRNKRGFNGVISNNILLATSDCCYKFLDSWHISWPKEKICWLLYLETFCGRHIFWDIEHVLWTLCVICWKESYLILRNTFVIVIRIKCSRIKRVKVEVICKFMTLNISCGTHQNIW